VIHEEALANLAAAQAVEGPPAEKLRALVEGHVLSFGRRLRWIRVFYTEYSALGAERRRRIMAERRRYEEYVDELLRAGQADGSFCPDLDPRIVGSAILTMVNTVYLWYKPGRDAPIEVVAGAYAEFALAGLRCPAGHAHTPRPTARRRSRARG
jgi:hypothetical protein